MAKERHPAREKAMRIYLDSGGSKKLKDIAYELELSDSQIRKWKSIDKWSEKLKGNVTDDRKGNVTNQASPKRNKGGAPPGNKNAVGNRGGIGGPPENDKAVKHGFFQKYLPEETLEIMQEIESKSPVDILWDNIVIQYTAIIRAQRIMLVRDKDDETKVLKREKRTDTGWEDEYELQHAWDKQANFLQAQSRAMATLQGMIVKYEDLCRLGLADEEQQLRIQKLKAEVEKLREPDDKDKPIEILIRRKGDVK